MANVKALTFLALLVSPAAWSQVAPGTLPFAPLPLTANDCVKALNAFQGVDAGAPCGTGSVTSGLINQLAWFAASGSTISGLATAANGVLVTDGSGVPSISSTLPSGLSSTNLILTTPILGTPQSGTLTNATGLPISSGVAGLGTGVATALGNAVNGTGGLAPVASPVFTGQVGTSGKLVGGSNSAGAGTGANDSVNAVAAGAAFYEAYDSSLGADLKTWDFGVNASGNYIIRALNDAFSASTGAYQITRGSTYNIGGQTWNTSTTAGTPIQSMNITPTGWSIGPGTGTAYSATLSSSTYVSCTALTTTASGVIACTASDPRIKRDEGVITPEMGLATILSIPDAHKYEYQDGYGPGGVHYGFMADAVQKVMPELVSRGAVSELTPDGQLQFDKAELGPFAVQAIKSLEAKSALLVSEIKALTALFLLLLSSLGLLAFKVYRRPS